MAGLFRNRTTDTKIMQYLVLTAVLALSFAWMWSRNEKAKRRIRRLKPTNEDEALFAQWQLHTRKRINRADLAALLFTVSPLIQSLGGGLLIAVPFCICVIGALILAFGSNGAGRKSDALAKELGLKKGVNWLASKK